MARQTTTYSKVWMPKRLPNFNAPFRAKGQTLLHQIDGKRIGFGEKTRKALLFAEGKRANILARSAGRNSIKVVYRWCSENVENDGKLMMIIPAREEGFSREHLCEDAADGPHVDGTRVLLECQHDLGSAVPSCGNIFCHKSAAVVDVWWRPC